MGGMRIAVLDSNASRARGAAVMLAILSLGACANDTQLLVPAAAGSVQVYVGDQIITWPAQLVTWDHPGADGAMPFSKELWDAGFKFSEAHCFLIDGSGNPTRFTLFGIWYAADQGVAVGRIGELVPHGLLSPASKKDPNFTHKVFAEAVWKASGGAPSKIEAMLREAVNHDAACLSTERLSMEREVKLLQELKAPVRGIDGRPGIITLSPDPELASRIRRKIEDLERRNTVIKDTIGTYGRIAQDLNRRVAAAGGDAARAPERPVPQPSSRPPVPPRIVVDTTPLQKEMEATQAALAKARQSCLSRAAIDCS